MGVCVVTLRRRPGAAQLNLREDHVSGSGLVVDTYTREREQSRGYDMISYTS